MQESSDQLVQIMIACEIIYESPDRVSVIYVTESSNMSTVLFINN